MPHAHGRVCVTKTCTHDWNPTLLKHIMTAHSRNESFIYPQFSSNAQMPSRAPQRMTMWKVVSDVLLKEREKKKEHTTGASFVIKVSVRSSDS